MYNVNIRSMLLHSEALLLLFFVGLLYFFFIEGCVSVCNTVKMGNTAEEYSGNQNPVPH